MSPSIKAFIQKWKGSAGSERANKDAYLLDLCEALEIAPPGPKDQSPGYCFEKDLKITHLDGSTSTGSIDLFKEGCFVLEAKQGSTKGKGGLKEGSAPVRGTRAYDQYMEKAFGQAVNYAIRLPQRPPFLMTCDIGHSFQVWDSFSGVYGGYGARRAVPIDDLVKPEVQEWFRTIWDNPQSLDPGKRRALVTRQVATELGHLAARLEKRLPSQVVANFLMRCVFTFFAEDVELLPSKLFERSLERWRKEPDRFAKGLERLWDAMNTGDDWGEYRLARFNGGLFAESHVPDLFKDEIELLHQAARFDWGEVDPSIFGTLLESALSPEERHKLGAHYTPRTFIERLIRPTIEEPLRGDWDLVQAEALTILGPEPTEANRAKAREVLHVFHRKLASTRILDPACGSGNFLYVAYDTLKRLEQEVLSRLDDFGETRRALALDEVMVTPAQFLGIEVKPWAAAIAELVLWIGHLQWWIRLHPGYTPPEPILQQYGNIQCRDAVLTWTGTQATDRNRWDGTTFKKHLVTGKNVPDETAQVAIIEHMNPGKAPWPAADFIVGNPPFLGNKRMRDALGDGYAEALREAYPEVSESIDFVMYWWHRAAAEVQAKRARRFGLITTNSIAQTFNRRVIGYHTGEEPPIRLIWAIPDHPWADDGADVRIAMTVGGLHGNPWLGKVIEERSADSPETAAEALKIAGAPVEVIHEDLTAGANLTATKPLLANGQLSGRGMIPHGSGFILDQAMAFKPEFASLARPYFNGRDIMDRPRGVFVLDTYGFDLPTLIEQQPACYQHLLERVKPERDQNPRKTRRERWWLFAESQPRLRAAIAGLNRFLVTAYTSKHRVFQFVAGTALPDDMLVSIGTNDAYHLGVLSSRVHLLWADRAGTRIGIGNDLRYNNSKCFDHFPFPSATPSQENTIRDFGERLDAHRKAAQGRGVTLTRMYNMLAKLRANQPFTDEDREHHAAAQTELLRQIHDGLDQAVMDAYGWPADLTEAEALEQLVALNKERTIEEAKGVIRWLRPEYQAPGSVQPLIKPIFDTEPEEGEAVAVAITGTQPWPKDIKEQLAALRALLLGSARLWTLEEIGDGFKSRGRYREGISSHLDLLSDLGVITRVETAQGPKFHRPQAMGA